MMEKPKRPMSAYLLWLNSARAKIKADHPGLKVTEVAKKAGELWRAMDDKSTWELLAAAAKERYVLDLETFNSTGAAPPPLPKRAHKRGATAKPPKAKKERPKQQEPSDEEGEDAADDDAESQ